MREHIVYDHFCGPLDAPVDPYDLDYELMAKNRPSEEEILEKITQAWDSGELYRLL